MLLADATEFLTDLRILPVSKSCKNVIKYKTVMYSKLTRITLNISYLVLIVVLCCHAAQMQKKKKNISDTCYKIRFNCFKLSFE